MTPGPTPAGTDVGKVFPGDGDKSMNRVLTEASRCKAAGASDKPEHAPNRGRRSKRRKWKKIQLTSDNDAIATTETIGCINREARSGEEWGALGLVIVIVDEGASSARARSTSNWADPLASTLDPSSITSCPKPPNFSYLDDLKELAEPSSRQPQSETPRHKIRRPRQKQDEKMESDYIPPHRRHWAEKNLNSTPVSARPAEVIARQLDGILKGSKNWTPHTGPLGNAKPDPAPRIRQIIPVQEYISPKWQKAETPAQTPLQTQNQNGAHQEISTASTKKGTGTTAPNRPRSPPSPPSSPIDDVWVNDRYIPPTNETTKKVTFEKPNEHQTNGNQPHTTNTRGPWVNRRDTRPPPKRKWLRNRDLRPSPKNSDEESDAGISVKSNSNGDPEYDIRKLTDWEGNWLPAPVEWEGRKGYQDRNFYQHIDAWLTQTCKYGEDVMDISDPYFTVLGDVAPRRWIPAAMEGESPQTFWRTYQSRAPAVLTDIDPQELPWWETYTSAMSCLLPNIDVPEAKLDPSEETYAAAMKDLGAEGAIIRQQDVKKEKERKVEERRRRKMGQNRVIVGACPDEDIPDTRIKPKANIYLRPAYPADMEHITRIYNYYVSNTIQTAEFNPRTRSQMIDRLTDITDNGLPFIVAVARSNATRMNAGQPYISVIERIVGYAQADDWVGPGSMYRYTMEMEMFVEPEYLHMGVGKCLMDKMLGIVDLSYVAKGGYEWIVRKDSDYLKLGSSRVVKTLNCQIPHDASTDDEVEWKSNFLRSFGFRKAGHLHHMGFKRDKKIDVAIFQYVTGEDINANAPPLHPM